MTVSVSLGTSDPSTYKGSMMAVALGENPQLSGPLADLDRAMAGTLKSSLDARDFRGARDEVFHLTGPPGGARRIVLIGIGNPDDRRGALRRAAAIAARQAAKLGTGEIGWYSDDLEEDAEAVTVGLMAGAWEYRDLKSPPPANELREPLRTVTLVADDSAGLRAGIASGNAIAAGQGLARTLAMMPGNLCTPEFLAATGTDIAARHGMKVTVLGRSEMEAEGMGALLCVAQGTPQDPKLIIIEYNGGEPGDKPVALVGKGLCFDTGGISIKPAPSMEDMKFDMCGAAG
ncbi:MAG: M17 family peptidase N-terminal domain-containing protein, partial [Gemmatimonadaceae bacterium]